MRRADLERGASRAAVLASLLTAGCGTIAPQVAYPNVQAGGVVAQAPRAAAAPGRPNPTLAGLHAADQRVADVAYRIVTANAALCSDVKPRTGLVLQTALQYSPRVRAQAERELRIGDAASVDVVASGSPAAEAGLRSGDVLLAVDGQALSTGAASAPTAGADERPATYAPVENAQAALDAALAQGPVRLRVRRGAAELEVVVPRRIGCAYDAQVMPGSELNASADGRHVFISAALVDYASSDDNLAVVLGHEFAHDVLHHRQREDEEGFARGVLGQLGSSPASHMVAEKEADYVGLYLAARAGYDISGAPYFVGHIPTVAGDLGLTHPSNGEREAAVAATRDEILAKRQRGEALIPTPATASMQAH